VQTIPRSPRGAWTGLEKCRLRALSRKWIRTGFLLSERIEIPHHLLNRTGLNGSFCVFRAKGATSPVASLDALYGKMKPGAKIPFARKSL